jgi:hypothetical protein
MLNNGILLSCAYDKLVIAWTYQNEQEIMRWEKTEELRCMDYIEQQGKLFVGTNNRQIMTIDISPLLDIENDWQYSPDKGFDQSIGKNSRIYDQHNNQNKLTYDGMDMEGVVDMEGMDDYFRNLAENEAADQQDEGAESNDQEDIIGAKVQQQPSNELKRLMEQQQQIVQNKPDKPGK